MKCEENQYDLIIIDSGNNLDPENGLSFVDVEGIIQIKSGCIDYAYHGTAINYLIRKKHKTKRIFNIGLCAKDNDLSIDYLNMALRYIKDNIKVNIVLICLGFTKNSSQTEETEKLIGELLKRNILVISAFDNRGFVSYPAAFKNVIGVEESNIDCPNGKYVAYLNSIVNISLPYRYYRTVWNCENVLLHGNSFAAAEFVSILLDTLDQKDKYSIKEIWYKIYNNSHKVINITKDEDHKCLNEGKQFVSQIRKAVVFPINKETIVLEMFKSHLQFEITDWYDIKYSGKCNRNLSELVPNSNSTKVINNINDIDWHGDFDTIILGHTDELEKITGIDYQEYVLVNAHKYGKKVYCYDPIRGNIDNKECWYPRINESNIIHATGKRLYQIETLLVAVMGTSSKQGKYTLQLKLKESLQKRQYKVAHFSTEPNGYLLGADYVYPIGHNCENSIAFYESVKCINNALAQIEKKNDPDIIIAGSQAGSIPYYICSCDNLLPRQHALITGLNPTAVVLCVNTFDEIEYIKRTVHYVLSHNSNLLGIAFLPYMKNGSFTKRSLKLADLEIHKFKEKIKLLFSCNAYDITNDDDMHKLCEEIIKTYS